MSEGKVTRMSSTYPLLFFCFSLLATGTSFSTCLAEDDCGAGVSDEAGKVHRYKIKDKVHRFTTKGFIVNSRR